ncbi:hypothetical protein AB0B25_15070 [Nocardia sp. NPDC049190]
MGFDDSDTDNITREYRIGHFIKTSASPAHPAPNHTVSGLFLCRKY